MLPVSARLDAGGSVLLVSPSRLGNVDLEVHPVADRAGHGGEYPAAAGRHEPARPNRGILGRERARRIRRHGVETHAAEHRIVELLDRAVHEDHTARVQAPQVGDVRRLDLVAPLAPRRTLGMLHEPHDGEALERKTGHGREYAIVRVLRQGAWAHRPCPRNARSPVRWTGLLACGDPSGIRTRVTAVRGRRTRPLYDGAVSPSRIATT